MGQTTLVLTDHPLLHSAVFVGQDGRNQQEGGSQERPPARNKEKRDARHRQQHRPHDGSEQYHQRADKPDQMTSKPKKKCDWLLVIPATLPKTWKVEYKMLITKATTTPKRPMSIASVRMVNCMIDLLLSAIRNHKTDCRFPPAKQRVEGITLHAACS